MSAETEQRGKFLNLHLELAVDGTSSGAGYV